MPAALVWTKDQDLTIRHLVAAGLSWQRIADTLGRQVSSVRMRGRLLGVGAPGWRVGGAGAVAYAADAIQSAQPAEDEPGDSGDDELTRDDRRVWDAKPPGHPVTWGAISDQPWPGPLR